MVLDLKVHIFRDYKGRDVTWIPLLDSHVLGQFWLYLLIFFIQEMNVKRIWFVQLRNQIILR